MPWTYVPGSNPGTEAEYPGYWFNTDNGERSLTDPNMVPSAENYWGWNPNMPVPEGGFTVGQLLAPNYLSQGSDLSDPNALRQALADVAPGYQQPATIDMNAQVPISQMRAPSPDEGLGPLMLMAPAIGGIVAAGMGSGGGMWDLFSKLFGGDTAPVTNWADTWGDIGGLPGGSSGSLMPAAIPETTQQLTEWGLKEVSPGKWAQPDIPDIKMSASDWFNYAKTAGNLGSLMNGNSSGALSAIQKLLSGNGSWNDGLSALGGIAPSLLGMYASNQQTNALKDLANKYSEYGAPYRSQLAEISADPNKFYNSTAAQQGVNTVLNKLSIGGNPAGSPYKQQLAVDSLWNDYGRERDRLAGFGGLTNYNASAPSLQAQAVNSQGNMYNALGAGLNDIFNPKTSLADLLKQGKIA